MAVAEGGRLAQGRSQLHRIAIAQGDGADAAVVPVEAIGGVEVLQHPVAVLGPVLLEEGMHPAEAGIRQGQLTAWIPTDAQALRSEETLLDQPVALPELQPRLAGACLPPQPPQGTEALVGIAVGQGGPVERTECTSHHGSPRACKPLP